MSEVKAITELPEEVFQEKMADLEQFERCRHLLSIMSETLGLKQPSWGQLANAYVQLADKVGVKQIAENLKAEEEAV